MAQIFTQNFSITYSCMTLLLEFKKICELLKARRKKYVVFDLNVKPAFLHVT